MGDRNRMRMLEARVRELEQHRDLWKSGIVPSHVLAIAGAQGFRQRIEFHGTQYPSRDENESVVEADDATPPFVPNIGIDPETGVFTAQAFEGDDPAPFGDGAVTEIRDLTYSDALTPAQVTADQDDYGQIATVVRLDTDARRTITGLAPGLTGQVVKIVNIGSNDLVLTDEDASSLASGRFALAGDRDVTLVNDDWISLFYDETTLRWREVSRSHPTHIDGLQGFDVRPIFIQYADVTVNSTTTETTLLSGSALGGLTLPATWLTLGRVIFFSLGGISSRTSGDLQYRVKIGSTTVLDSSAWTPTAHTGLGWDMTAVLVVQSVGVSGTVQGFGRLQYQTPTGSATYEGRPLDSGGAVTIDTTASHALDVSFQPTISNALNLSTVRSAVISAVAVP